MITLDKTIFRMYDIRGEVPKNLNKDVARIIGKAYAVFIRKRINKENLTISVGRDARISSKELSEGLIEGLRSSGINVIDIGLCPTPLLYFSLFTLPVDGGIMITGSHNPPQFNGMKICVGKETIYGPLIQELYEIAVNIKDETSTKEGSYETYDIISAYKEFLIKEFQNSAITRLPQGTIKLVIDSGNGCGGLVVPDVLRKLGVNVIDLFSEPDGNFPNHHPDPTVIETLKTLRETVIKEKADFGVAYDGDADRIGVVDEKAEIVYGDRLAYIFAKGILKENPGAKIIGEVKCSKFLFEGIEKLGGIPVLSPVGHSLIKKKLREENALFAGEMSGHIFFNDRFFGYDDAIYATMRLVELYAIEKLQNPNFVFSDFLKEFPKVYASPEIRVHCSEEKKFEIIKNFFDKLKEKYPEIANRVQKVITIDGVRLEFDDGWALARASNTEPVIVLRFEANTEERLKEYQEIFENIIKEC
ncbi:phosphomannomutase/phosphoglucomutase [Dictyoglomus thermophilum]|uniref:Phosphomannomutase/phosphoglucomutase n=1 Tax=Dictyoglomus thermophilum TaxID=14 RepID=A0A7C2GVL1_DICTH|nr:phosphomannomutase/phosphoglucomutase [Dictyoglomus thermophilum]TYT24219.1 phosphomannomutase/phosphoglucomutase [Dictyoglomus thermophilum]